MDKRDHKEISEIIERREKARHEKRWAEADAIRDDLVNRGVQVVDRDDLWRCGTMVGLYNPDYDIKDGALRICLDLREEARAAKDYANADFIRDMLKDAGVELKDREGIWWSTRDQRHGELPVEGSKGGGGCTFSTGPRPPAAAGQGGGRGLVGGPPPRERSRSPPRAPPPHGGGQRGYSGDRDSWGNGKVPPVPTPTPTPSRSDDRRPSYPMPPPPAHRAPSQAPSSSRDRDHRDNRDDRDRRDSRDQHHAPSSGPSRSNAVLKLNDFLLKREELRQARDWEGADKVRDVLGMLGVTLNDREKRWSFPDGRSGEMPPTR